MLEVVYEDNHVIVCIKPVGVPSQADKTGVQDMLSMVKSYIKEKYNKPGEVYVGLVHRLDRSVSGLMIFARTSKAASRLSASIRDGDFKKEYLAIVCGKIEVGTKKTLENDLYKIENINTSYVVKSDTSIKFTKLAKHAKLEYQCIKQSNINNQQLSLLKIKLYTGRHHQIRVQMSHAGFPLFGDTKYGGKKAERLFLYSCYISVPHPTKDEILSFNSIPKEGIWSKI